MSRINQKTISKEVSISGIGLHTGSRVNIKLMPAEVNEGIRFKRVDLPQQPVVKVEPRNILIDEDVPRCTSIGRGDVVIHTVEHIMSVLCALGISNLLIEIDANELPGLDGSGAEFLKHIKEAGITDQEQEAEVFSIFEPIGVELNGCSIYVVPSDEFKISYVLDYDHSMLSSQFVTFNFHQQSFEKEIAPCRTFCLEKEAKELQKRGLGQGANHQNTLVVGETGVIDNEVYFKDEFARHKILDFIGDLYLLGVPIVGHVFAVKSGHSLNLKLLKKVQRQRDRYKKQCKRVELEQSDLKEINIEQIMNILPHRYPFLLVDKVMEIEKGKKAIGIKNVTINDGFFQGHFPARPVMPGVLMIEAMAQTAGVVVLTSGEHHGKLAFFLAVDKVKFRRVVSPGDQLLMEVEVIRSRTRTAQIKAVGKVNGEIAVEADMVFSFTEASYLD